MEQNGCGRDPVDSGHRPATSVGDMGLKGLWITQSPIGPSRIIYLACKRWSETSGTNIIVRVVTEIGNDVRADRIPIRCHIRNLDIRWGRSRPWTYSNSLVHVRDRCIWFCPAIPANVEVTVVISVAHSGQELPALSCVRSFIHDYGFELDWSRERTAC